MLPAAVLTALGFHGGFICTLCVFCRVCQPNIPVFGLCVQPLLTEIGINSNKFNAKINIYTIPHINNEREADANGARTLCAVLGVCVNRCASIMRTRGRRCASHRTDERCECVLC